MNNFVIQSRAAATATAAAFCIAGHSVQEQTVRTDHRPIIKSLHAEGSVPSVVALSVREAAESAESFERVVASTLRELVSKQVSLDPGLARAMAENAWDLYEGA